MVFSVLIANTDDHLRNHRFLAHATERWRDVARQVGLSAAAAERRSTAFEHAESELARSL